jgi:hypothetical protein
MAWPTDPPPNSDYDAGTDDPSLARLQLLDLAEKVASIIAARAQASGICDLDVSGKIPVSRLPGALPAPVGTRMVFYQAAAPTGWTQVTSVNDRVLRVVSGTGGGTGGGWTITGLNVLGHTLSISEIPAHAHGGGNHMHTYGIGGGTGGGDDAARSSATDLLDGSTAFSGTIIDTQGGGGSHDHGISHNGGWRPSYIDVIVGEKA